VAIGHLSACITTINDDIAASSVRARVASEVDIGALQLFGVGVTAHGDHGLPQVLDLLVNEIGETSVNVAGGDAVDAGKVSPLVGQRFRQVDAARLGDVVGCLLLWEVGDVTGHGGGDDQAARLAFLEVVAHGLSAVEGAVQVGLDDFVPRLDRGVEDAAVGRASGVGNEDIDLAKVLDDILDQLLDALVLADVALVGLGLDAVLLLELLGVLVAAVGTRRVRDGHVGAHLSTSARGLSTDARGSGGAGDDDHLALQAEHVLETAGCGDFDRHDDGVGRN
jgi:hypothetical protein